MIHHMLVLYTAFHRENYHEYEEKKTIQERAHKVTGWQSYYIFIHILSCIYILFEIVYKYQYGSASPIAPHCNLNIHIVQKYAST